MMHQLALSCRMHKETICIQLHYLNIFVVSCKSGVSSVKITVSFIDKKYFFLPFGCCCFFLHPKRLSFNLISCTTKLSWAVCLAKFPISWSERNERKTYSPQTKVLSNRTKKIPKIRWVSKTEDKTR